MVGVASAFVPGHDSNITHSLSLTTAHRPMLQAPGKHSPHRHGKNPPSSWL